MRVGFGMWVWGFGVWKLSLVFGVSGVEGFGARERFRV